MKQLFSQEYYWPYKNKTYSMSHTLAIGFFTFALCYWVRPFDLELYINPDKFLAMSIIATITNISIIGFINIFGLPVFFPSHYEKWTVGKEILWTGIVVLLTCTASPVIMEIFFRKEPQLNHQHIINIITWCLAGSIVPLIFSILINHMRYQLLKSNTIKKTLNEQSEKISPYEHTTHIPEAVKIPTEKGIYTLHIENLLLIKSNANYSEIYIKTEEHPLKIDKIRCTISTIEEILKSHDQVFRCHRTYIINLSKIESYTGTASKGFLIQNTSLDFEIPVSRSKGKSFKEHPLNTVT